MEIVPMNRSIFLAAAAAACLATPGAAQQRTEIGLLDCVIEGGAGFLVGSQKDLTCTFTPANGSQPAEAYVGTVTKFGLDVGVTGPTLMRWLVVAPTGNPLPAGSLAGDYVGASAEATAGIGAGANVLVGGSNQTIALQPVSIQAQTGLNLAVGVSSFRLRMAG
jgi:hypothetical protein